MSDTLELKAEIDDLNDELSEYRQTIDDHNNELLDRESIGYDRAMLEIDSEIDNAFSAGFKCADNDGSQDALKLKALLNYKMEQRL